MTGARRKRLDHKRRGERSECRPELRDLLGREVAEVRQEDVARAEPHGHGLAVQLAELLAPNVSGEQAIDEIDEASVTQAYGGVHEDFSIDKVSMAARLQPREKFIRPQQAIFFQSWSDRR